MTRTEPSRKAPRPKRGALSVRPVRRAPRALKTRQGEQVNV